MKSDLVEILATLSFCGAIFLLIHQQLTTNDAWFNLREFWHHESFIAISLVASVALLAGKYLGRR